VSEGIAVKLSTESRESVASSKADLAGKPYEWNAHLPSPETKFDVVKGVIPMIMLK
jgi:hypothetical protein